ncbi:MerR family transcriptional regulator [Pediococcus ethanolidurans]|uniref:Transcriptional regulator n=1 Tax=Pediococcus ethanolidurans TaxID=319653 RepID=A0A0R2KAV9_9LACO|nr:MerR family transcriptional regulator [Pediococcus ethanolidurans]KRN83389.1 transcriptional regulator [Pediococcus ethanolidurans]GEN94511.1 MerR family transcriptional regulator [Pediococcus ethanolidurans]SER22682.1 DNA-binding transcriptional regulator, MerR family [Pediococcus ethanolidurans]
MTYTIKEVAQKFDLSIYTLRFYDKQGLLPFVQRNEAGYRVFTDTDLSLIKTICCLKDTDMKIRDIRQYIDYVMAGPCTIKQREQLLTKQRNKVLAKQQQLTENLKEIDYKLQIYRSPKAKELITAARQVVKNEKSLMK